jgi:hypothetical protein
MIVGISSSEVRPAAIHRAAVDFDTPHTSAAARTEPPGTAIGCGTLRGRPSRVPCVRARQPGVDALADALALELGDCSEDVHLEFLAWRRRIDACRWVNRQINRFQKQWSWIRYLAVIDELAFNSWPTVRKRPKTRRKLRARPKLKASEGA